VVDPPPPMVVGERVKVDRTIGLTVRVAVLLVPPQVAVIVAWVAVVTTLEVMVKVAEVAPAATVTLAGTEAAEG